MNLMKLLRFMCFHASFCSFACLVISGGSGITPDSSGTIRRVLREEGPREWDSIVRGYMSNGDLEKAVKEFGKRCASISRIYRIGKSVRGVPLWVIEISDKPGKEEPEPAFKFIGNVHGDEPVGRELLIYLANWLCENFQKDPLASFLVENLHIHILPSMNPDGFSLRRRGNANNIDLNRDFPDQFFPMNDDVGARQPETKAIMRWLKETHFTASASFHGGALVANYPWDGTQDTRKQYNACPDDDLFRQMASTYSRAHHNMSRSKEFDEGITNGAYWYPIYGGMQDWNYIHAGCFEMTLEVTDVKWPPIEQVPVIWEYNRMSMLNLAAFTLRSGVRGRIYSSDTGRPLPALVTVRGINYSLENGRTYGDYYRMLSPRTEYQVTVSAAGHVSKSTRVALGDAAMTLDFILDPTGAADADVRAAWNRFSSGFWGFEFGLYCVVLVVFIIVTWKLWPCSRFLHSNGEKSAYQRSNV